MNSELINEITANHKTFIYSPEHARPLQIPLQPFYKPLQTLYKPLQTLYNLFTSPYNSFTSPYKPPLLGLVCMSSNSMFESLDRYISLVQTIQEKRMQKRPKTSSSPTLSDCFVNFQQNSHLQMFLNENHYQTIF